MGKGNVRGHKQPRTAGGHFAALTKEEKKKKAESVYEARLKRLHLTPEAGAYLGQEEIIYGMDESRVPAPKPLLFAGDDGIDPDILDVMTFEMQSPSIKSRLHNRVSDGEHDSETPDYRIDPELGGEDDDSND